VRDDVLSALEELSQVGGSIDEAGTILNWLKIPDP
jgi:hypothetical protein